MSLLFTSAILTQAQMTSYVSTMKYRGASSYWSALFGSLGSESVVRLVTDPLCSDHLAQSVVRLVTDPLWTDQI